MAGGGGSCSAALPACTLGGLLLLLGCLQGALVTVAAGDSSSRQACQESGYCSLGTSKPWSGDIQTSSALKQLLDSVAFKKELIISIFQEQPDAIWVEQVQQLHHELLSMGYAHHLFITLDAEACKLLKSDMLSCVWDSSELPLDVLGGETALWHNRWKFVARVTRLGYNVMSVDTDFIFFRDPYIHLKRPPFSSVQFLAAPEGGSNYNCNGGFVYIQNVRPDGPVTWVFKQVVMSTLRRGDDKFTFTSQWSNSRVNCLTFDQSLIMDALAAAGVGRPIFPNALSSCKNGATFKARTGQELTFQQVQDNVNNLVAAHQRTTFAQAAPDPKWLSDLGLGPLPVDDTRYLVGNITVPNLAYGYAEELGGRFAPSDTGPLSDAWVAQLQSDCPTCPWWPERRALPPAGDPLQQLLGDDWVHPNVHHSNMDIHHDANIKPELYAQGPRWFETGLVSVRRGWFLGPKAPSQGPQILGHIHAWHMQTGRPHKTMLRKVLGRYNWTLGEQYAAAAGHATPYLMRGPVTRVLALSPHLDLARTRNWSEFSSIVTGLLQVAHLSHRVVLLPDLPCETAWLHDTESQQDSTKSATLCLAPMFWRQPYRYPLPVPVPVDARGELIGGWARRLRQHHHAAHTMDDTDSSHDISSSSHTSQDGDHISHDLGLRKQQGGVKHHYPGVPPVLLQPATLWEHDAGQQPDGRDTDARQPVHKAGRSGNCHESRHPSVTRLRQLLQSLQFMQPGHASRQMLGEPPPGAMTGSASEKVSSEWWTKQRFVAVMPQLWDPSCTRDMQGIISAEFFHWLKYNEHGKTAALQPGLDNTILLPGEGQTRLQLHPPPPAGSSDSAAVPRGSVVSPSDKFGWSLKDIQAAAPVTDVVSALKAVANVPLVYLGHPVMVVHSHQDQDKAAGRGHDADAHMERIDRHRSKCKAVWTQPETHHGTLVNLTAGIPVKVVSGRLVPL